MRCDTCQLAVPDAANFCASCGAALARLCTRCGQRNPLTAKACAECQLEFSATDASPRTIASRSAREGERKHLTVLIADVAGSTAMVDHLDAEEAAKQLGVLTAAMREAVSRFEGTVNKFQGDGIMALFGAPILQEDHAVRACCAALAMIESIQKIAGAPPVRVGINTGEVVVRAFLTDLSEQYDAMGRTVHIAARLEHEASDFGIAISGATMHEAAGMIDAEPVGEKQLRGISDPISVYALKGIRAAIASQQFRGGQKLSPFVGRHIEIDQLNRAMEDARRGAAPVVGVAGEAGSGKSRLTFEFLERCRDNGLPVLEARATGYGRATPLRPILDLIRTFFGIHEDTSKEVAAQRVQAILSRHALIQDMPLILDFLGLPNADKNAVPSDVALRRLRLLGVLQRLARAVAQIQPSVFVVEDLHWLDPASEAFIEAFANCIAGTTTLMLVNFRKGYSGAWMGRSYFRQITLAPLGVDAIERMLDHSLGNDPSVLHLRHGILERANGNPFFAEELIRSSIDQGVLSGVPGSFRAANTKLDAPLPTTVEAVLGSRIDRLPETNKLVLQAASVVGKEFSLPVVAKVAQVTVEIARVSLQMLLGAEMLYERLDVQRNDFAFRHPLVQEAAYGSLLTDQRHHLHRGTAAALAVQFRDRLDEYSSLIAHHWEKGGEKLFAASSYLKFALWIGARDPRHALESWRNVRRLLQERPPSTEIEYMLMMACGQIVNYAWWQGIDAAEIKPIFEEAITLAHKLNDTRAAALITMAFGRILVIAGSSDDYVGKVEEAQKFNEGTGNRSIEAVLKAVYAHALLTAGHLPRALEANTHALGSIDQLDANDRQTLGFDPGPWLTTHRARILMYLGKFPEADAMLDELLAGPSIETVHRVNAHGTKIEGYRKDRPADAAQEAERIRIILQENATPYLRVLGSRYCAIAMLACGAAADAANLLTETISYARAQRAGLEVEPYLLSALAEALAATNSPDAKKVATEARDLARRRAMRTAELEADRVLSTIVATG